MLLLTLRGTPTCYYGDELGMRDGVIPEALAVDPQAGGGSSRDGARTPMQWSAAPYAGFTVPEATPWLPVDSSFPVINVEAEDADPNSHLALYRRLLALRREYSALHRGGQQIVEMEDKELIVYIRDSDRDRFLVVLNFGPAPLIVDVSRVGKQGRVLCSTLMDHTREVDFGHLALRSHEGLVIRLE